MLVDIRKTYVATNSLVIDCNNIHSTEGQMPAPAGSQPGGLEVGASRAEATV